MQRMKIESYDDLKNERRRLRMQLQDAENRLAEDWQWVKDELKPVRVAGKWFSSAFVNKDKGIANDGVRYVIDVLLKNVILSRASWVTRLIVPFIAKNISSNLVSEKKPELLGYLKTLIHNARKKTNHDPGHYDRSTAHHVN